MARRPLPAAGVPAGRTIKHDRIRRGPQRVWDGLNRSLMDLFDSDWTAGRMTPWRGYAPPSGATVREAREICSRLYEMLWDCYLVAMAQRAADIAAQEPASKAAADAYIAANTRTEEIAGIAVTVRENGEPVTESRLAMRRLQSFGLPGWSLADSQAIIALLRGAE